MDKQLAKGIAKAGIPTAQRHLFVCIGPDCCRSREGEMLWELIKKRVKTSGVPVMRTKAGCFRICRDGPLMVVYPEGTWYSKVTPARFERIFRQHVMGGKPVEEWIIAENALGCRTCPEAAQEAEHNAPFHEEPHAASSPEVDAEVAPDTNPEAQ